MGVEHDEFFKNFLHLENKCDIQHNMSVPEQIQKLSEGIETISKELQDKINFKHKDLLSQASCSHDFEIELAEIGTHVERLHSVAEKIKSQITTSYNKLELDCELLNRLNSTCHILRHIALVQDLFKELEQASDLAIQAKILRDLMDISEDPALKGIEIISSEIRNISSRRENIIKLAKTTFSQGVISKNKSQINSAIQILINLGTLKEVISEFVSDILKKSTKGIQNVLITTNVSTPLQKSKQGPGGANISVPSISKNSFWNSLESFFLDDLFHYCRQVHVVQNILIELQDDDEHKRLGGTFWTALMENILIEMKKTSVHIQNIFEEDYPKLLKLYSTLTQKLNSKDFLFKHSMVIAWENTYLSKSLARLLDPVNEMFATDTIPNHDQIDALIRIITSDLSVALVDESLSSTIAKNVAKCIRSFAIKTENLIATSAETSQTIGVQTPGQQHNVKLANTIHYLKTQVERMLTNMYNTLPSSTNIIVKESLQSLDRVVVLILTPLTVSINSTIETIIVTIHLETDWNRLQVVTNKTISCSPYMRELIEYIVRAHKAHLASFLHSEALLSSCSEIAVRCIELFVRHTILLRPISYGGRLRLQADYQHLESGLISMCPRLPTLGRPYRLLKSMATLIVLNPSEIVKSQLVGSSVPQSTILLLLFTYAGPELHSPHQLAGWSIEKLSAWLDEHPGEKDRLELISGALQAYVSSVRKHNVTNYDSVYVLMSDLLKE